MVRLIAEVGVNHNGDFELAKSLILAARDSGADAVKFQYFKAIELASTDAELASYQSRALGGAKYRNQLEMLSALELGIDQLVILKEYSTSIGLEFFVSAFSATGIREVLTFLELPLLKIPSGEINNEELIRAAASSGVELIISTGMSTLPEIERAVEWVRAESGGTEKLTVMQCTTSYPTNLAEVNLLAMVQIKHELGVEVGFSDHTEGSIAALGAVALGAASIEKHITLSKDMEGPDHKASLEPHEFGDFCSQIHEMVVALGKSEKAPTPSELSNLVIVRKSPFAISRINPGELFSRENVALKRPQNGLDASLFLPLMGRPSKGMYEPGDPILGEELG